jgi:hypothetical protein
MNEIEPCIGKKFIITEADLIKTVISVRRDRGIFPNDDGPTRIDCQNLKKISSDSCSEETKDILINFMLKFGKIYKKDYPIEIEHLRTFELEYKKPKHRDHICHSFRVWSLGLWFYHNGFRQFFHSIHEREDLFDFVWYLTAFYHDIGYVEKHTLHGGDSAQLLLKNLNSRFNGKWTTDAIHAIVAICLHDKKEPVDIKKDPYSALLIICDEIQEWGRNIPRNEKRCEIDKLQNCMNLSEPNPSIEIVLFYPEKQTKAVDKLKDYVTEKERDLDTKVTSRIKNLTINVKCVPYSDISLISSAIRR